MSEAPEQTKPLSIWGRKYIDNESIKQIENALSLPISVAGALMPDAHVGYGCRLVVCWRQKKQSFRMRLASILPAGCE